MQALLAKMNQCLRGWQTFALQYHEDMSFMTEEEPKAAVLWRADIVPGNYEEAMHYLKADILPSMKKAGLPGFLVYTTIFGEGPDLHVVAMQRNFAELDKGHPVRRTNNPEEARQIFARGAAYFRNATVVTMRHLPDLSYDNSGTR